MNFYPRFIGDYQRDTSDLPLIQDGAYNRLLDSYYATEKPIPPGFPELFRICRAIEPHEQDAVKAVVEKFFPIGPDGLRHNKRADEEIAKRLNQISQSQTVGKLGGRPRKNPAITQRVSESKPDGIPATNPAGYPRQTRAITRDKPSPSPSPSPSPESEARYRSQEGAREPKVETKQAETETERFANWQRFKATYPRGTYPEADFMLAEKSGNLRLDEGTPFCEFLDGAQRFRDQQDALGNIGTRFVPSPKNFFDRLTRLWTEKFPLPAPPTPKNGHDSMESWTVPVGDPRYDADLAEKLRNEAAAQRFKAS